jgi:hypothetical protein
MMSGKVEKGKISISTEILVALNRINSTQQISFEINNQIFIMRRATDVEVKAYME